MIVVNRAVASQQRELEPKKRYIHLYEMVAIYIYLDDGSMVSLQQATPEQFNSFIAQYVKTTNVDTGRWSDFTRWNALNFALACGKDLELYDKGEPRKVASLEQETVNLLP